MRLTESEYRLIANSTAIPYLRESSVREVYKVSIEIQDQSVGDAAEANDVTLAEAIVDSDKTGRNFDREIQEAIRKVLRGEGEHIYVMNLTRFGRNLRECLNYLHTLNEAGHYLISSEPDEGVVDIRTASGRKKAREAFAEAESYSDKVGDNWRKAIDRRQRKGLPHGNSERWGYTWCFNEDCKRVDQCDECVDLGRSGFCKKCPARPRCKECRDKPQFIIPEMKDVVRDTFLRLVRGEGSKLVVNSLNDRGYRTPRTHKLWDTTTLFAVFDTGFHAGLIRDTKAEKNLPPGQKINRRSPEHFATYIEGAQDAMLTPEEWVQWVKLRGDRKKFTDNNKPKYAESTLVFCECGTNMTAGNNTYGRSLTWRCSASQRGQCNNFNGNREIVSELVLEFVRSLADSNILAAIERSAREYLKAVNAQPIEKLEIFEHAHVELLTEYENLQRNFNKGLLRDEKFFIAERDRLEIEIKDAERQLRLLKPRELPNFPDVNFFTDLLGRWGDLDPHVKRNALKRIIWRIEVRKGRWEDRTRYQIIPLWQAYLEGRHNPGSAPAYSRNGRRPL